MKRYRYSFMLLAVAFASVLFCSCSKDDTPRMSEEERLVHLDKTLLMSFDMTINAILSEGRVISPDTISARNELIANLS